MSSWAHGALVPVWAEASNASTAFIQVSCRRQRTTLLRADPTPSKADIEMTQEVREAAEKLGIALHDHLVVSKDGYTSFKTMGLL